MASLVKATHRLQQLYSWLEARSTAFRILVGYSAVVLFGVIDYMTGYEVSFSVFYLLPVCYVAWSLGKRPAVVISFFSAAVWFGADLLAGATYSNEWIPLWNAAVRLGFFITASLLVGRLNEVLTQEKGLAAIDGLTGIANQRSFHAALNLEVERSQRYQRSFTLAYIDLDDFKAVNDQLGHSAGDFLLRTVAQEIVGRIRSTDTVGRLGGDEFAILFPETRFETSYALLENLQAHLLEVMHKNSQSVTFSIGAVSFDQSASSADEALRFADNTMYRAKSGGKNRVVLERFRSALGLSGAVHSRRTETPR
jgi:diguanylate cyclase (GGDEF)-like protein